MSKTARGFSVFDKGCNVRKAAKGFSVLESMVVVAIAGIVLGVVAPSFTRFMRDSRRDGAAERIAGDVRKARARAITTGWQYRVYGFNGGANSVYKGQYRMMGRSSSGVSWPADNAPVTQSTTQMAGPWIDLRKMYSDVTVNPADSTPHFSVAFDSRGVRVELDDSFDPLYVGSQTGSTTRSVTVSAVGSVAIQ